MGKKIAIVGTTTSLFDAPYDDPTWELWGLNGAYTAMKRWDKWFDMHDMEVLEKNHNPAYFPFLKSAGDKLTLNKEYEGYPEARVFPYEELVKKYGRYFTNTVSWLIALAIEQEDVEEIGIWGVNMAQDEEYGKQRPSCEYFLGVASGKGIKVTIPEASELLKATHLYGVEKAPAILGKFPDKQREITINKSDVINELERKKGELNHINGYIQGAITTVDEISKEKVNQGLATKITEYKQKVITDKQNEAAKLNGEVSQLYDKKAYHQGAADMLQYYVVNWCNQ